MRETQNIKGFTLTELAILLAMIILAFAVAVPAMQKSRADARGLHCKNQLRIFGVALWQTAEADQQGHFTSGSHDYLRDGCYDTYGWVADIVNGAYGHPSKMLCPMQPPSTMQTYQDMFALKEYKSSVIHKELMFRLEEGACKNWLKSAEQEGGTKAYFSKNIVEKGYTTNYAASWYLNRCSIKFEAKGSKQVPAGKVQEIGGTLGPLSIKFLEQCESPSANIPMLGDISFTPLENVAAKKTENDNDQSQSPKKLRGGKKEIAPEQTDNASQEPEVLANTMTPGPMMYDADKNQFIHLDELNDNSDFYTQSSDDFLPSPNDALIKEYQHSAVNAKDYMKHYGKDDKLWMQDTRTWGTHTLGNQTANILFADGSVKQVIDLDGDGLLNPGFPSIKSSDPKVINYHSLKVELPPYICFSGVYLRKTLVKGTFE